MFLAADSDDEDSDDEDSDDEDSDDEDSASLIPSRYNSETELTAKVEAKDNVFDFALESEK